MFQLQLKVHTKKGIISEQEWAVMGGNLVWANKQQQTGDGGRVLNSDQGLQSVGQKPDIHTTMEPGSLRTTIISSQSVI